MSTLIRHGAIEHDEYIRLGDEDALPAQGCVVLSFKRWSEQQDALRGNPLSIGVQLPNTLDLASHWPALQDRPLLVLEFPLFSDGRAYSQARLLRERFAFKGEIRASGAAVVRDQLQSMNRSGFTSFELRDDQDPQICLQALDDFSMAYQPTAERTPLVRRLRQAGAL